MLNIMDMTILHHGGSKIINGKIGNPIKFESKTIYLK